MQRLLLLLFVCVSVPAEEVNSRGFLSGCWAFSRGPLAVEEQWTKPAGGALLGLSRTMRDGRMVFHEYLRIEREGADVVYTPQLSTGARPVAFKLVRLTKDEAVFENPDHDFPQRIIYTRTAGGLTARTEGVRDGQTRSDVFPYKRVACP